MEGATIGIDVGGTKTAYGIFGPDRALLKRHRTRSDPQLPPEAFFEGIAANVLELTRQCGIRMEDLRGIGIGMPSYIQYEQGYIVKTVNLTNIKNFAARDFLHDKLGHDVRILMDNDSHTGALAEYHHGAGRGLDDMIYCPVSTGISSGIIIGGRLLRGRYGWAGESGHMLVPGEGGVLCGCGNTGCLMSWCSGSMIVKHIQKWIERGEETVMTALAGSAQDITTLHLNAAWEAGDAMAIRAVDQMARYMAIWIYNLYVTLNINCYVFGGGLLRMGDKLFGQMRRYFDEYNQDSVNPVYFRHAELEEDFGIVGAAELLYQSSTAQGGRI